MMKPTWMMIAGLLAACGSETGGGQAPDTARSDKQRITAPVVDETTMAELTAGNSGFAFDLYQQLRSKPGNLFYSPLSISLALAMTYAGAEGSTESQMKEALHFTLPEPGLHTAFNALDLELASRGTGARAADGKAFRLRVANSIWGQTGYPFLPAFLDVLAENYGSGLNLLDFAADPEESRVVINDWVSNETEERIKDLLPPGIITSDTRLVLCNAVYFNAGWALPFDKDLTADGPFHLADGAEVTVPMMHQTGELKYAAADGVQAVELPYDGHELSMVLLVPDTGMLTEVEATLDAEAVGKITAQLAPTQVELAMPKFKYELPLALKPTLTDMGMVDAFVDGRADFSGIDGGTRLSVSAVLHKAFVAVNEAGTEAAAATAVVVGIDSVPPAPVVVTLDRPFLFFIRDLKTGAILFIGRVANPA